MSTGNIISGSGKNLLLERIYENSGTQTAVVNFRVGSGSQTPVATGTDLNSAYEDWNANTGTKAFTSVNRSYSKQQIESRGFIASTSLSGSSIAEVGEFNEDTHTKMFSHNTFNPFDKTNQEEVSIIWVHSTDTD